MSQNSVSSVILRFALDEQSQRRVLKGVGDIEQVLSQTRRRIVSVEDAAAGLNAEFADLARAKAIDNLSADAIKAATETGDWARELERVSTLLSEIGASDSEIKQVARSLSEAQTTRGVRGGGSSNRGGGGLENVDRFGTTGSQVLSALGQGEAANAVGLIGDVAQGFSTLNPLMLGITGATVAFTAVIGNAINETNRITEATKTRIEAERAAAVFLRESNREQLEERLADLRVQFEVESELYNRYAQERQRILDELNPVDEARAWAGLAYGELRAFDEAATASNQTLSRLSLEIEALNEGLMNNATATTDAAIAAEQAAAAEKELDDARQRFVEEQLRETAAAWDNLTQSSVSAQIAVQRLTETQRTERIAEIEREIEILQRVSESTRISSEYADSLNKRIAALSVESMILADATNTLADGAQEAADALKAQEEATALISQQTDNYFTAVTATVKAQEALTKAQQDAQKVYDDYMAKSLEISTQTAEKEREILADGGDKRADIERRTQDAIAKTMREYGREQFNAVAERDALAAYQAKQRAEDQLTDEQKARADAIKEQEKAQAKALASLQSSVNQQTRTLETSYRNQQALAGNAALRAQIDLQNAKASEIAIAANGANGMRTIYSNFWGALTAETVNGVTAILTQTRKLVGGMGGTSMYVNGVNAGSPAAYDLYGVGTSTRTTTQAVFGAVDQRLNQYFRTTGITRD